MATTTLVIKSGQIIDYSDRYFHSLSEDGKTYSGNGWDVTIKEERNGRPGKNNLPRGEELLLRSGNLPP